ncbi:MAG: hypothetical protein MJ149_01705, partial [Clostridia bacterium]|nr:hypothetical protein [Clostridia bacterium]
MKENKKVKFKLKHLVRHFGFKKDELTEIRKMYSGEFFNPKDEAYKKLLKISASLCEEYNHAGEDLGPKPSLWAIWRNYRRKCKIVAKLFPIKGILSSVGPDLQVVVGLVDFNGCGFINKGCHFSPYTLVDCDNYTIFANKITIGDDDVTQKGNKIRLGKIHFGADTWMCAGATIKNNSTIGTNTVVGAGATVVGKIGSYKVAIGRPAVEYKTIDEGYKHLDCKAKPVETEQIKKAVEVFKRCGFSGKFTQAKRLVAGLPFNTTNLLLGRMYLYTHRLCVEFNSAKTSAERKEEILNILFPHHGKNLRVGTGLYVDLFGITEIGNNVTLGKNCYLAGLVKIEDNVTIGDDVSLFASGHGMHGKERRVGFSLFKGLYEYTIVDSITVKKGITIADDCVVAPK